MKTKKIVIAAVTAVLVTALIIGCNILQEDSSNITLGKKQPAPSGKTSVRINLGHSNARTIRGDTSSITDENDFDNFLLLIYDEDANAAVTSLPPPFDTYCVIGDFIATNTIDLTSETEYTFTVIAFLSGDPVAWGYDNKTITGTSDTINITLKQIVGDAPTSYNGTGTFTWNPDVSAYATAKLSLAPISSGTNLTDFDELDLIDNGGADNDGTDNTIPSGYYRMILELGNTGYQTVYVQEAVHIYSGFESTYAPQAADLPTLRINRYTITLDYGEDVDNTGTKNFSNIAHGTSILTALAGSATPSPSHDAGGPPYFDTDHVFNGWYYGAAVSDFTSAVQVHSSDKLIKTLTLTAKWGPRKVKLDFGVTLNWSTGPGTPDFTGSQAVYDNGDKTMALTLTVSGLTGVTSYRWVSDTLGPLGNTATVNLPYSLSNSSDEVWWQSGTHNITLWVNGDEDSFTFPMPPYTAP
jgi:uncharacterized repeat protein (TIGR02543 family)